MMPSVIATRWKKSDVKTDKKQRLNTALLTEVFVVRQPYSLNICAADEKQSKAKTKKIHGKNMGMMVKYKEYVCITNTQVIITWFRVGMQRGAKERKHRKSTFT